MDKKNNVYIDAKNIYNYILELQDRVYSLELENKNLRAENKAFKQAAEEKLVDTYLKIKKSNKATVDISRVGEAYWEIDFDGYYPYCTSCHYEPSRDEINKFNWLPPICPNCGKKMMNYDKYINKKNN